MFPGRISWPSRVPLEIDLQKTISLDETVPEWSKGSREARLLLDYVIYSAMIEKAVDLSAGCCE